MERCTRLGVGQGNLWCLELNGGRCFVCSGFTHQDCTDCRDQESEGFLHAVSLNGASSCVALAC